MTDATSAFGTLLKVGDGAAGTEAFTTLAEVNKISGPKLALDTEEVTHHSSPGGFDEYVPTVLRGGEISLDINFLPGDETQDAKTGILKDMKDKTLRNFQIVFPTTPAVTWKLSGYITAFEPDAPVDGKLGASVTIKVSGEPDLGEAA